MRRIDFVTYIKPLLRATGLIFLVLFLLGIQLDRLPLPPFKYPSQMINFITEFLERSTLLSVALLCLAISLADRTKPPSLAVQPTIGLRDRILMGSRFLVGIAALFYLMLIPYLLMEAQALYHLSVRSNEQRSINLNKIIDNIVADIDSGKIEAPDLPALLEANPWLEQNKRYRITKLADLKKRFREARNEVKESLTKVTNEWKTSTQRISIRSSLLALFQATLIGYFWYYWPRDPSRSSKRLEETKLMTGTEDPIP